jgi:septum formation protein
MSNIQLPTNNHKLPQFQFEILLASKSPRRQQLFQETGFNFKIVSIDADESFDAHKTPAEISEFLAKHKAAHYHEALKSNQLLVTADTIVYSENNVLNKPNSEDEAFEMLSFLSGKTHQVFTGVAIKSAEAERVFHESTEVTFKTLTHQEIWHYIKTASPMDKAGSYGVQDWMGFVGVSSINGCFYNVMGFPMSRFWKELNYFIS